MSTKQIITTLAASLMLGLTALPAMAETEADMSFDGLTKMERMDKNKDGMVSKKEFLDMMSAMWDAKAKKMKMKDGMMSGEDFKQVLMYLKAGS
jgi:hypothetical protein